MNSQSLALVRPIGVHCNLCANTGENRSGIKMCVNNHICPRCGGYGTVPVGCSRGNQSYVTKQDIEYATGNGIIYMAVLA